MDVKTPSTASFYDDLARVYDRSGQSRFSLRMVSYLLEILALNRLKPRRVLDLACGTGAAAVALARRRFELTGVDGSEAMLARARARAERWGVTVDWQHQALTELSLCASYDIATCFYDSLNHLIDPLALRQAFFGVRQALAPGGLFLFDMNTPYALARVWGHGADSYLAEDYARFWRSSYDDQTGLATLQASYFLKGEDARFDRIDIVHQARGYTPEEVHAALREAGFEPVATYACLTFEPADSTTYRVAYLARAEGADQLASRR